MKFLVPFVVTCFLCGGARAQSTIDVYSIDLAYPYRSNDAGQWFAQSYRGLHHVELSAIIGDQALRYGNRALGLDQSGPLMRFLYLLTAGQLDLRFQVANGIMFSHEMAHFANISYNGWQDPAFTELVGVEPEREYPWLDVYSHFFFTFNALAAAGNVGAYDPSSDRSLGDPTRRQFNSGEGLNTQSWISERMFRDFLAEGRGVFSAASFLNNRFFAAGYALVRIPNGDTEVMAATLARRTGGDRDLIHDQILLYSFGAALLSPASWAYVLGLADYVQRGDLAVSVPAYSFSDSIRITYDVATYANFDSFVLAPTVYAVIDAPTPTVDKVIVGLGAEMAVIGSDDIELSVHTRVLAGKVDLTLDIAYGGDFYIEPELRYSVTPRLDLLAGGAFSTGGGTSLRSRRLNQFNQSLFRFGLGYRFSPASR